MRCVAFALHLRCFATLTGGVSNAQHSITQQSQVRTNNRFIKNQLIDSSVSVKALIYFFKFALLPTCFLPDREAALVCADTALRYLRICSLLAILHTTKRDALLTLPFINIASTTRAPFSKNPKIIQVLFLSLGLLLYLRLKVTLFLCLLNNAPGEIYCLKTSIIVYAFAQNFF